MKEAAITEQEAARRRRVAATIADGIAIQHRFRPEPLLKSTGRGSYQSEVVSELTKAKSAKK